MLGGAFLLRKNLLFMVVIIVVILVIIIAVVTIKWQAKLEDRKIAESFEENIMIFSAEEIIRYHNEFIMSRNFDGIVLTYTTIGEDRRSWRNAVRNFTKREIISIEEIVDETKTEPLFNTVSGISDANFYEIKFFAVDIEIERREQWGYPDGIVEFVYIVARETPEAPWSILISTRNI